MSDGGSVFPRLIKAGEHAISEGGVTLRNWFAGQALAGLAADGEGLRQMDREGIDPPAMIAKDAYKMADAMLAEGAKVANDGPQLTHDQIKHMVSRFLRWRLPENFSPDAGISFKAAYNENTAHPMKHEPVGTNLFDFTQAEAMVRHMLEGMPK